MTNQNANRFIDNDPSNDTEEVKLSLKVTINKENNKVLFAEADSDFADVLVSFLTLPLGKIVRLLNNHYGDQAPQIGKLTILYKRLSELKESRFSTPGAKQMLLDPGSSFSDECSQLKVNVDDTMPAKKYFRCGNEMCSRSPNVVRYHGMLKCDCGENMNKPMCIGLGENRDDGEGVFVKKGLSFLITDDLKMVPVEPDSFTQTLFDLGVTIMDGAQMTVVPLGLNEVMDLLRACLLSKTPLTDFVFCRKFDKKGGVVTGDYSIKEGSLSDSKKKLTVKGSVVRFKRSGRKLMVLKTRGDFVDLLCSLLFVPLGGVEWLLGGDTGLITNMGNLYRSVKDCVDEKCFVSSDMKSRLVKPKLPSGCLSEIRMLPIEEEVNNIPNETVHFKDPKGGASYVKSSRRFFVFAENLSVSRDCKVWRIFWKHYGEKNGLKMQIGLREALDILCSSFTSSESPILENLFSRANIVDFDFFSKARNNAIVQPVLVHRSLQSLRISSQEQRSSTSQDLI